MLVQAGSRALGGHGFGETLDFDSVDRCFAMMAAAAFVGLIAVVVWMMASTSASASKSARISRKATAEMSTQYRSTISVNPSCARHRRCGAVALGCTYLLPPLSSGGALVVRP
jgi:hypothetical protein